MDHPTLEEQIEALTSAFKKTIEDIPPAIDIHIRDMLVPYMAKWKRAYFIALTDAGFDELQAMQIVKNEQSLDAIAYGGQLK